MKKSEIILKYLSNLIPNPVCELNYRKDYELLIAVVLSAQSTDKRVNLVTKELFKKYNSLEKLKEVSLTDLEKDIRIIGTYKRKSQYIKDIATSLIENYNGIVPNTMEELIKLNGVGRKTVNVVLSVLYKKPAIAVDTHVSRVSKRLGLVKESDNPKEIEIKLNKLFPQNKWSTLHHQLVLFGRYYCQARKPKCRTCQLHDICVYYQKKTR